MPGGTCRGLDVVYLFADAVYESLRRQAGCREGILVTWAIVSDGRKMLVHLSPGGAVRGLDGALPGPGAPGAEDAVEGDDGRGAGADPGGGSHARPLLKLYLEAIRDAPYLERGCGLVAEVVARFEGEYPSAMRRLQEDLEGSLAPLRLPAARRRHVQTTNLVERSFEEERRRAKVLPPFRSERECLKPVFAVLWRASKRGAGAVQRARAEAAATLPGGATAPGGSAEGGSGCHRGMTQTAFTESRGLDRGARLKGRKPWT